MAQALKKDDPPVVGILTGSPNDLPLVEKAREVLHGLGVPCEVYAMSAHRTPDKVLEYVRSARERGIEVLVACAGMAAHLAGVVAANTTLPVVGVPLSGGLMSGLDALLSTVQMPSGIPVATVAVDGTRNAGFLAARILAGTHPELVDRIEEQLAADRAKYS
jgi:5-(carboxyamino)imidazole ribonucleotide mutase